MLLLCSKPKSGSVSLRVKAKILALAHKLPHILPAPFLPCLLCSAKHHGSPICVSFSLSSFFPLFPFPSLPDFIYLFLERGGKGGRKRGRETLMGEEHQLVASHMHPTGDWTLNPGMCPDWESNWQPFTWWDITQPTEPHQSGHSCFSNTAGTFGSQGFCICCFFCLESSNLYICTTQTLTLSSNVTFSVEPSRLPYLKLQSPPPHLAFPIPFSGFVLCFGLHPRQVKLHPGPRHLCQFLSWSLQFLKFLSLK